uniref:Uncharacterized protein n=1 Tax=Chelativorans sp. (strain BNC1) TaxID=266779 RepID=Q11EU4_CHESB
MITPVVAERGSSRHAGRQRKRTAAIKRTAGTPRPWTFNAHHGRSPGLQVIASVRPSQRSRSTSGNTRHKLAAYSCGGSAGLTPASLLSSRPERLDSTVMGYI